MKRVAVVTILLLACGSSICAMAAQPATGLAGKTTGGQGKNGKPATLGQATAVNLGDDGPGAAATAAAPGGHHGGAAAAADGEHMKGAAAMMQAGMPGAAAAMLMKSRATAAGAGNGGPYSPVGPYHPIGPYRATGPYYPTGYVPMGYTARYYGYYSRHYHYGFDSY